VVGARYEEPEYFCCEASSAGGCVQLQRSPHVLSRGLTALGLPNYKLTEWHTLVLEVLENFLHRSPPFGRWRQWAKGLKQEVCSNELC
jgi:hypothetical protein